MPQAPTDPTTNSISAAPALLGAALPAAVCQAGSHLVRHLAPALRHSWHHLQQALLLCHHPSRPFELPVGC